AFGHNVLAEGPYDFARDDTATNGGLDDDLEHLPGDEVFEPVAQLAAPVVGLVAVDDSGQRIRGIAIDEDIELHQVSRAHGFGFVVERGIATRHRLQAVVKIRDDLGQRQLVMQQGSAGVEILGIQIYPAPFVEQLHNTANIFGRHKHLGGQDGLTDFRDRIGGREGSRVLYIHYGAIVLDHFVAHVGHGSDDLKVMLAFE